MQQTTPILFGELIPNEHRYTVLGLAFGLLTPLAATAPGLGKTTILRFDVVICLQPLIFKAREFAEKASWRWVYYLSAILAAISGLLQLFFYFPPTFHHLHKGLSKRKALLDLDYGGIIIFTGGLTSLLLGISWGGQAHRMFPPATFKASS